VSNTRCGYVAVIGAPNAGKSTLINTIVGQKVSIVSSKVQTTRTRVLGIALHDNAQIILVDTPGIFENKSSNKLEKAMVASAYEAMGETDILLVLVDAAKGLTQEVRHILSRLQEGKISQAVLALNKIDKLNPEKLLSLSAELNDLYTFKATFMISALKNKGVDDLVSLMSSNVSESPWLYPEDQISDMPMRLLAAEITREKLFHKLHQELPYRLTVETENWENFDNGSIKIDQTIYVTRDSHKKIILGKGGEMIKKIGETSRHELENILGTRVHLKLFVKVRENWLDDRERFLIWGLDPSA